MSLILVDGLKDRPGTGGPKFPNGLHLPAGIGITGDGHINMAGVCTFSGNVTIGGTLTYEDVTNIDSVGVITARSGVNVSGGEFKVGTAITVGSAGVSTFFGAVNLNKKTTVNATLEATEGINVTAGVSTFAGNLSIAQNIIHTGDTDTKIHFSSADQISFDTGGTTRVNITSGGNLEMPNDDDYIKIGASGDLQLVHTGGISYITDSGNPVELRSDTIKVASGVGTERIRVLQSGVVNIGESVNNTWIDSIVKIRKDQNDVTRLAVRNENQGSDASAAIAINSYGNSWTLDCGSAAKNSNAFTINVDATSNSNQGTEKFRIITTGEVGIGITNPTEKLHVIGQVGGSNPSVGSKWDIARFVAHDYSPTNSGGLTIGAYWNSSTVSDRKAYIQSSQSTDSGSTARALLLNPDGGNVAIGTATASGAILTVQADSSNTSITGHNYLASQSGIILQNKISSSGHFTAYTGNIASSGGYTQSGSLVFESTGSGTTPKIHITQRTGSGVQSKRLTIDTSGKIGIGIDAPDSLLHINGDSATAQIRLTRSNAASNTNDYGRIYFESNDDVLTGEISVARESAENDGYMHFKTATGGTLAERVRITKNGRTYINTISPIDGNSTVAIRGSFGSSGCGVEIKHDGNPAAGRDFIRFYNQSDAEAGSIEHNAATSVAYKTSSDYRLKENIVDITDGIERLKLLKPRKFSWIEDPELGLRDGFIAHEVSPVIPHCVSGEKDAVKDNGKMQTQTMEYSQLTPLLTAALQEAIVEIETLKAEVAALKSS